ncbi:DNA cytosine methyltransferase [Mycobacteroides saopaulense]|uniref:Cytosine-specific methyltransferase n=1 Tax=Mycobacteroides saopaulense TaxID=1578165 RepID=A0ABX3C2V5_9MYCO|nr:DNA cytosine methyltransferase [Mycobacteroides saopaulense]OHT85285.1 hypothetical protein BKG68_15925 [Mycobacteroides saopaulense]OHU11436.1 hypothetical protein BKG73_08965 [Mycobacteroides saopaulense]
MSGPVAVSVFSGAMGLDLGLERAGFDMRFAADIMPAAIETIKANRPKLPTYDGDVRNLTGEMITEATGITPGRLDLLAGGPPCQSFSTAGKRLSLDDADKGPLVFEFVRLIEELQPRAFLMENVKGLLSASIRWRELPYNNNGKRIDDLYGSLFAELLDRLRGLGYSAGFQEVNAANYGAPQTRLRVFVVGYRDGVEPTFPVPTHAKEPGLFTEPWRTFRDAVHDLTNDESHCARFSDRKMHYLRQIPEGGNWRNLPEELQRESMGKAFYAKGGRSGYWRRLRFDAPAPTILTEPHNASTALCHPTQDRPLTVRECARVQTFPDNWQFAGRGADQYRLIGNAVPVVVAQRLGDQMVRTLEKSDGSTAAIAS